MSELPLAASRTQLQDGTMEARDDFEQLAAEVAADPVARGSYEDAARRESIVLALVNARKDQEWKQAEIADRLGTTQSVLSSLENLRTEPRLSTLQRYARVCGRVVVVTLKEPTTGLTPEWLLEPAIRVPEASDIVTSEMSSDVQDDFQELREEVSNDPVALGAYNDSVRRNAVVAGLVEARKRLSYTQQDVAKAIGARQSAVSELENDRTDPRLSTLQRYARACQLVVDIAVINGDDALAGIAADIAQTESIADPVLVEVLERTASVGVGDVLRRLIKIENQLGLPLDSVLSGTRLSPSATHRATQILTSRGWLAYSHDRRLKLIPDAATFIGVSIRPDHVRGLIVRLDAVPDFGDVYRIPLADTSPSSVVNRVTELVEHLRPQAQNPLGVGVELAGPVRGETGEVVFAPDLQPHTEASWQNFPLEDELQERLGSLKVIVANDATALATRELLQHGDPGGLVVVTLSESTKGIGAGLVVNGRLITGVDGQAGEIGHIRVPGNRRICPRCGTDRKGCLETIASGFAIATDVGEQDLTAAALRVERGDAAAIRAFRRGGKALGRVIGEAVTWLDAARLVIFGTPELAAGDAFESARRFAQGVAAGLAKRSLTKTDHPEYLPLAVWVGPQAAATVAINDFLDRPLKYTNDMMARARSTR
jgi:predicted NBD/HSP70 family sugar kinase/transcriptional regulator with XRE-family HTH domain